MGISRDSKHKRRASGGKRKIHRKKRKYELGRPAAMTRVGPKRIHLVRCRGGAIKHRALKLEQGNFSWGSEAVTRKTRLLVVVYNASNNELVRTNTLVKNSIIQIDATPFRSWYEQHYGIQLGKVKASDVAERAQKKKEEKAASDGAKDKTKEAEKPKEAGKGEEGKGGAAAAAASSKKSDHLKLKLSKRRTGHPVLDPNLADQFNSGRLYACISSRPGQSGRSDGYILEGEELAFYLRKLKK